MASLRTSSAGVFLLAFRYPPGSEGRQYTRSLETKDTDEAKSAKVRVESTIRHLKAGVLVLPPDVSDDELWQFLRSGGRLTSLPVTRKRLRLRELAEKHANTRLGEATTQRTERIHYDHLARLLGNPWFDDIAAAELRQYIIRRRAERGMKGRTVAGVTICKELATFRLLWKFAASEGYVQGECPLTQVKQPKKRKARPFRTWAAIERKINRGGLSKAEIAELWDCLFLDEQQIGKFLRHVDQHTSDKDYRWIYYALCFCAYTGARRSEMMRAQIDDIDFANKSLTLRERKADRDHEETYRAVPLHASLQALLDEWLVIHPGGQLLFVKPSGAPLSRTCHKWFLLCTNRTEWQVLRGFHVLRHSFASNLARNGVDDRIIRKLMGHRTEEMTERYRHLFPDQQEAAIELLTF